VNRGGSVGFVGDVMVETARASAMLAEAEGYRQAIEKLRECDLRIGNLEMPVSDRGYKVRKYSNLRSHPSVMPAVAEMGFHAVSLANNHMMDYGPDALADTLMHVHNAGIAFTGAGNSLEQAMSPVVLRAGNARVGFLSFSSTLPVESDAGPGKPGIAPIRVGFSFEVDTNLMAEQPGTMPRVHSWTDPDDRARACDAISALRQTVDFVAVAIHWGVPSYWLSPSQGLLAEYQQVLGHAFVDAGADAVIGHHSHSLHPIEVYAGKPIFYSLGNFLFEGARAFMEPESIIARFDLVHGWELIPLMLDKDGFPALADGEQGETVISLLAELSQRFGDPVNKKNGVATLIGI
jgi:poly-gamma-glutamate capsule biosynthesis protein CapA/YwtB (metallophosphatase superfamily)